MTAFSVTSVSREVRPTMPLPGRLKEMGSKAPRLQVTSFREFAGLGSVDGRWGTPPVPTGPWYFAESYYLGGAAGGAYTKVVVIHGYAGDGFFLDDAAARGFELEEVFRSFKNGCEPPDCTSGPGKVLDPELLERFRAAFPVTTVSILGDIAEIPRVDEALLSEPVE